MRVLFYTDTYLPNRDGVVTSMLGLKRQYEKKGHQVFVFSSGYGNDAASSKDPHVKYFDSLPFVPYPSYKVAIFPYFSLFNARAIKPGMIHCHALATMCLAASQSAGALDLPSVATFHTMVTDAMHYISREKAITDFTTRAVWAYLRWILGTFDVVTVPSFIAQARLAKHGIKAIVVPNGIDTKRFSPGKPPRLAQLKGLEKKKIALFIGRIVREKNLELLIKGAKKAQKLEKDIVFVIAGTGPAVPYYKEMAAKAGVARLFRFIGFVPDKDLASLYKSCSCFVQPSKFETQGLTVLEALSCGKPACVLAGYAPSEIARNGVEGFWFSEKPESFAKAVDCAVNSDGKLAARARKRALEFSAEKCAGMMLEAYKKAAQIHRQKNRRGGRWARLLGRQASAKGK